MNTAPTSNPSATPTPTSAGELLAWPAWKMAQALQAGTLSPVELVEAHLARIEASDARLHAYTEVFADEARAAAQAAELARRAGHALGPWHGVPIAIKDLVEVRGRVTTDGSAAWRARRATQTATLVRRLLAQGMVILGKTQMTEFAMEGWGTNAHLGTPRNPWDWNVVRAPGGSSSGSAVAVAGQMAPWAIGTDTGGSVRVPAAWCGLTGLKTSVGRVSRHGVLPTCRSLDTVGPLARDARDARALYRILAGPDPLDPSTLGLPASVPDGRARADASVAGLRLARMPDAERSGIAPAVLAAYDRTLAGFADGGAELVTLKLPFGFAEIASLSGRIMAAESYAVFHTLIDDPEQPLDDNVRSVIARGRGISACDYLDALDQRARLMAAFDAVLADVDALLMPTSAWTAPALTAIDRAVSPMALTRFANFLDLPVVAMPNGADEGGLPTSVQVIGRRHREEQVLSIACAHQARTDWHTRRAPRAASEG